MVVFVEAAWILPRATSVELKKWTAAEGTETFPLFHPQERGIRLWALRVMRTRYRVRGA
jgi:hypothetical protein